MPSPEGLPARRAALVILDRMLRGGQTADSAAQGFATRLSGQDFNLALAIAGETVRRLVQLDALIDSRTRQPLPEDSKARMVLRLALAQRLALNVPDHALVATALPLVDGGPRRLVHGVLSALLKGDLPSVGPSPLPQRVESRWREDWGDPVVEAARAAIVARPPLDLSFKSEALASAFASQTGGRSLGPRHVRLPPGTRIAELPGFDQGDWWVQDLAASLPARLIPAAASRVLDACAAPGGKTMQLAAAGHQVTALDRSESRLARLSANLARTGLAAKTVVADALDWEADSPFDAVLLDAPCSATGTFRRHPEVLYRARPAVIADLIDLQARLLDRAADWVTPGGSLVYAVCSLERGEGEAQIEQFLKARDDFRLVPATEQIGGVTPDRQGWLRVLPGMLEEAGGLDGFFAAHLVRSA